MTDRERLLEMAREQREQAELVNCATVFHIRAGDPDAAGECSQESAHHALAALLLEEIAAQMEQETVDAD